MPSGEPRSAVPGICELFLEAVFALHQVLKPGEPPFRVGGLDAAQGGEDVPVGFVGQVGVGLAGLGVLFGVEPAMFAGEPGAIGFSVRDVARVRSGYLSLCSSQAARS
ncbi:MAG: hypothetical protein ABSA02_39005 [Trebonia sp.]